MIYVIKYQLNKPGKDYTSLYSALQQYDYIRDNVLHSTWFVSTSWTAGQIYEHLRHHLDVSDRIFITRVETGQNAGWMDRDIWTWINSRL
jgi:hypothetical protein